jgi:hypothetical protein
MQSGDSRFHAIKTCSGGLSKSSIRFHDATFKQISSFIILTPAMLYSDEPWSLDYNTAHEIPKPPFPYVPGKELTVVRHHPPSPPSSYLHGLSVNLEYKARREREQVDVVTRCLLHPPAEGELVQNKVRMEILNIIRAEDGKSSQVVTVRILSGDNVDLLGRDDLVAKFYDPLYHNHYQDNVDPFLCV